jgi:hypothetical protein
MVTRFKKEKIGREDQPLWEEGRLNLLPARMIGLQPSFCEGAEPYDFLVCTPIDFIQ